MRLLSRKLRYYLVRLFRLKNGARQISMGLALGFIPSWFPTFGLGPMLSVLLARFVRGNIPAAIIAASFGSFIWPLLFFLNYKTGSLFYSPPALEDELSLVYIDTVREIGIIFIVGALLNTLLFGIAVYFVFYFIFRRYRKSILIQLRRMGGKGIYRGGDKDRG